MEFSKKDIKIVEDMIALKSKGNPLMEKGHSDGICDCIVGYDEIEEREIVSFCPLHEAAPDYIEAIKLTIRTLTGIDELCESETIIFGLIEHLRNVLTKANPKP